MASRLELQKKLEGILGTRNVYFQPPESLKLQYPCIVYSFSDYRIDSADNIKYRLKKRYSVTVIDKNPDSAIPDLLEAEQYVIFDRPYKADNLNHWVFDVFW